MKKVVIIFLCIFVLGMVYLVYDVIKENNILKLKIIDRSELIKQNENDKKIFESKAKELESIRENNKDKVSRYDEVETWNQEIIRYLD